MIQVTLETPKELNDAIRDLQGFDRTADRHLHRFLELSTKTMEGEIRPLTPVGVSSRLRNSIASQVVGTFPGSLVGKVGSTLKDEVYPAVMEFGRRPGAKMPPPSALERWVHLKLGVPAEVQRGVAFTVARAIARRGIKGRFFMRQGFEKSKARIVTFFGQALDYITQELLR
jgi:hypothetical protein